MKEKRHAKILELILSREIGTQEELCELLNQEGFVTTQATVSRDIKELKLTKISVQNGRKKYILLSDSGGETGEKYSRVFRDGVVSVDMAQNILVLHTASGMAMAVAVAVDAMDCEEIAGCIAGDDTVMCAVRSVEQTEALAQRFRQLLIAERRTD